MIEILSMYALRRIVNRDDRIILKIQRIFLLFLLHLITILLIQTTTVNAEEQKRSSTLNIEKTTDGDTERLDYIDENGNITYAADKHYATVIKKKSGNTLLEEYFDAAGKPAVQSLGHYAILREYNDEDQNYKITYLGIDGNPVIIRYGYSTAIRTFNEDGYIEYEMYFDTEGKPIETKRLAYGCYREYNENGRNIRTTYLDQNHKPTLSGQGFSILCRSFYEDDRLKGKVKEEYYFDTDNKPISLSLGQYGVSKEYDDFGRETVITYLDAHGNPIINNEGYTAVKKTYNNDDSIKTEQYYDIEGNPVTLSEGQNGYRIEDGVKIYIDSEGYDVFNLRNFLYSHQSSVIIICVIIVLGVLLFGKKINTIVLLFYIIFIFYMTFLHRKTGLYSYNLKPFWSYKQFFDNKGIRWEIINNILLFIPLGTILYQLLPQKRVLLLAIGLSVFIELVQLISGTGLCEIDDLISNTIGGVIGFFIGIIVFGKIRARAYSS